MSTDLVVPMRDGALVDGLPNGIASARQGRSMHFLDRLAAPLSAHARVRVGLDLIARGRGTKGFGHLARAARRSCAQAQYHVARCYLEGQPVQRSLAEAMRWLQRAASGGHADAQFLAAALHVRGSASFDPMDWAIDLFSRDTLRDAPMGPDYAAALAWAQRAAKQGHAKAQALLGYILTAGPAALRDPDRAQNCFRRSARAGCPQGALGLGLALLQAGRDEATLREAAGEFRKAAEGGVGVALYLLGAMTEFGVGLAPDAAGAAALYRAAAGKGVRQGQRRWALALLQGRGVARDVAAGEVWLRRAANEGDVEAAAALGCLCAKGGEVRPDYIEAASWLQRAAEQGHAAAARMLGQLYFTGVVGAPDPLSEIHPRQRVAAIDDTPARADPANPSLSARGAVEALDVRGWFEPTADAGDLVAAVNLAIDLVEGVSAGRDARRAAQWLRRAAERVAMMQYWYGRFLLEGRGVAADAGEARVWLARAADAGIVAAQVMLGELLLNGRGGPPDRRAARNLFTRAAAKGDAGATFALGVLAGDDGARVAAQSWFRQAAEGGHAYAQLMLGRYLAHGLAGSIDPGEARHWLRAAQAAGVTQARLELERLRDRRRRRGCPRQRHEQQHEDRAAVQGAPAVASVEIPKSSVSSVTERSMMP